MFNIYIDRQYEDLNIRGARFREFDIQESFAPEKIEEIDSKKSMFLLDCPRKVYSVKLNAYLNHIPVIYYGADYPEYGILPDFTLDNIDKAEEQLEKFWQKRKNIIKDLHVVVQNTPVEISSIIDDVYVFIRHIYPEEEALYLKLAIDEALINAYKHGNKKDTLKKIRFGLKYYGYKIEFTVEDEGDGFNVGRELEKELDVFAPCGRGLRLIKNLMDEVVFKYKGNIINMTKYIERQGER
jgi:serine/threonine-protein kinase RsbW